MFEYIEFIICYGEGVKAEEVKTATRKSEIVFARQLIIYFSVLYKVGSYAVIGGFVGGKDHSTVCHSIETIQNYIETDKVKRMKIEYYSGLIDKVLGLAKKTDDLKGILRPLEMEVSELTKKIDDLRAVLALLEEEAQNMTAKAFTLTRQISDLKKKIPSEL